MDGKEFLTKCIIEELKRFLATKNWKLSQKSVSNGTVFYINYANISIEIWHDKPLEIKVDGDILILSVEESQDINTFIIKKYQDLKNKDEKESLEKILKYLKGIK